MNKDTVEVIINEGGLTCTTTNPLGSEIPRLVNWISPTGVKSSMQDIYNWQQSENDRITYDIDFSHIADAFKNAIVGMDTGTIHRARIENGKAIIL